MRAFLSPDKLLKGAFYAFLRVTPRRRRFQALALMARALAKRIPVMRSQPWEKLLYHLLLRADARGLDFLIPTPDNTFATLKALQAERRPILLLSLHSPVNIPSLKALFDAGIAYSFAASDANRRIPGTDAERVRVLGPTGLLLAVRTLFRRGGMLAALIDQRPADEPHQFDVSTSDGGLLRISYALPALGYRYGAATYLISAPIGSR